MKKIFIIISALILLTFAGIINANAQETQVNMPTINAGLELKSNIPSNELEDLRSCPQILSLTNEEDGVSLTWTKITNAVKYRVYVKKETDLFWRVVTDTTNTSAVDQNTISGQKYLYTVRAMDKDGIICVGYDPVPSEIKSLSTPVLNFASIEENGVNLSWQKVEGAKSYEVYRKLSVEDEYEFLTETNLFSFIDTDVEQNVEYQYTVKAKDTDFESAYSKEGLRTKSIDSPKLSKVEATNGGIKISWEKVAGADKYMVIYSDNGTWKKAGVSNTDSFIDKYVQSNKVYTYSVRALSQDEKSYISLFEKPGKSIKYYWAPTITSVTQTVDGPKITWAKVDGVNNYRVYYKTTENTTWRTDDKYVTKGTSFTIKGATTGYHYSLSVQCLDDSGNAISPFNEDGKDLIYLEAPKFTYAHANQNVINLEWSKVDKAELYRVYYKSTTDDSYEVLEDTESTSLTYVSDKDDYTYQFAVRCMDEDAEYFTSAGVESPVLTSYLLNLTEAEPDENYTTCCIELSDEDRDLAERICMGEASVLGFDGMALVAQCVRDTFLKDGYTNIADILRDYKYDGSTKTPGNEEAKAAVRYIFDEGGAAVQHRIIVFYASDICHSSFHESQHYICSCGAVRFFDYWN